MPRALMKMEVPYNFNLELLKEYAKPQYQDTIDMIFLAPYRYDSLGAKRYHIRVSDNAGSVLNTPLERSVYEDHLKAVQDTGLEAAILLQDLFEPVMDGVIERYLEYGIRVFTVTRNDTAAKIRQLAPDARIISSITRKLSWAEYAQDINTDNFDEFVLYFPFNRGISRLAELNQKQKYVMLTNCTCSWGCIGYEHWYAGKEDIKARVVGRVCKSGDPEWSMKYEPEYLSLLAPYIHKIKLQGREHETSRIIAEVQAYHSALLYPTDPGPIVRMMFETRKDTALASPYLSDSIPRNRYDASVVAPGALEVI